MAKEFISTNQVDLVFRNLFEIKSSLLMSLTKPKCRLAGDRYEGQFVNNKLNGQGVFYYKEAGLVYNGSWLDNKRNGFGVLTVANTGQKLIMRWENDVLIRTYLF